MEAVAHFITGSSHATIANFHGFFVAGILLIITLLLAKFLPGTVVRFSQRIRGLPGEADSIIKNIILAVVLWVGILGILQSLGLASGIATFSSVLILSISFALQQVLEGLASGFYLLGERPYHIGDYIVVDGSSQFPYEGVVKEIKLRITVLIDDDGIPNDIPSLKIFTGAVKNYGKTSPAKLAATKMSTIPPLPKGQITGEITGEITISPEKQ